MKPDKKPKLIGLDKECVALIKAINLQPGIITTDSCCGHGNEPFRIWFRAARLRALPNLLYWFDGCHCGHCHWRIIAKTDCVMCPVFFMIEGPMGKQAYAEAAHIARLIERGNV